MFAWVSAATRHDVSTPIRKYRYFAENRIQAVGDAPTVIAILRVLLCDVRGQCIPTSQLVSPRHDITAVAVSLPVVVRGHPRVRIIQLQHDGRARGRRNVRRCDGAGVGTGVVRWLTRHGARARGVGGGARQRLPRRHSRHARRGRRARPPLPALRPTRGYLQPLHRCGLRFRARRMKPLRLRRPLEHRVPRLGQRPPAVRGRRWGGCGGGPVITLQGVRRPTWPPGTRVFHSSLEFKGGSILFSMGTLNLTLPWRWWTGQTTGVPPRVFSSALLRLPP